MDSTSLLDFISIQNLLPSDIWSIVFPFLPVRSLIAISRASHFFHSRACDDDAVWEKLCQNHFRLPTHIVKLNYTWRTVFRLLWQQPEQQLLDFELIEHDDGCFSDYYGGHHIHSNDKRVYCSAKSHHVHLLSRPQYTNQVLINEIVCVRPVKGIVYMSPLEEFGCIFTTHTTPPPSFNEADVIFASSAGTKAKIVVAAELQSSSPSLTPSSNEQKQLVMQQVDNVVEAHFLHRERNLIRERLMIPQVCSFVVTRLHRGRLECNIDMQFLGFTGKYIPNDDQSQVAAVVLKDAPAVSTELLNDVVLPYDQSGDVDIDGFSENDNLGDDINQQ